jgi:ferredoxin
MNFRYLKIARVVCGLVSLVLLTSIFLFPGSFQNAASYLQLGPLSLRTGAVAAVAAILIVPILLTLLWGRVYCSFVCPVGVMQDIVIHLRKFITKSGFGRKVGRNYKWLRYSVAAILIAAVFMGTAIPFGLLDPFSIFGRFCSAVINPLFVLGNNILSDNGLFDIYPREYLPFSLPLLLMGAGTLSVIMITAVFKGRLFCNTLCPVGAVLGLISKVSLYKIRVEVNGCVRCGKCAVNCKAGCIDHESGAVDVERCVSCFNCLTVCGPDVMTFSRAKPEISKNFDFSRRDFFVAGSSAAIGALAVPALLSEAREFDTVLPPGAENFKRFTAKCTGCQLCVSNCPGGVLKPASLQYGLRGFIQPHLDFDEGMCEYDCTVCSDICPSGALLPVSLEDKHRLQLGVAEYFKRLCVVKTDHTHCGACAEHCPTGAVHMVPWRRRGRGRGGRGRRRDLMIPQVEPELCIGCGACEYVCPVLPQKAIVVTGFKTHSIAEVGSSEQAVDHLEGKDFPF